jgi:hypothetical protein
MPTGFRAFTGPVFRYPKTRLCVAGFMTRIVAKTENVGALVAVGLLVLETGLFTEVRGIRILRTSP